jgi:hypothetical protein
VTSQSLARKSYWFREQKKRSATSVAERID